ncbi:MAG: YbaB/EbfC family nucleoid-associated protein [Planctomycetota bacterium]|jgi:DNA-binding YbaB/EbfC family protein
MAQFPGGMGAGGLGDLVKHAQKAMGEMQKIQAELEERLVEGTAGGGAVVVTVSGARRIVAVKIDPEAVDPEDLELLEDMIRGAVNDGMKKADKLHQEEMSKITGGLNLPGLLG